MTLIGAAKFSPAATMPSVVSGTVLDVILRSVRLPLTMDPHFAVTVRAADFGAIVDQAHLA